MNIRLSHISLLMAGSLLAGCASTSATLNDISETASGRITEIKDRAQKAVEPIVETAKEIDKRVKQVQSGAKLIQDGVNTLKEGIGQ